jgi:hypothetical protein
MVILAPSAPSSLAFRFRHSNFHMKPLPILLGLSLTANAAFFLLIDGAPRPDFAHLSADTSSGRTPPPAYASSARTTISAPIWEKLRAGDPSALSELRAAGWPDDLLRELVLVLVNDLYRDRERAAQNSFQTSADYWKERSFVFQSSKAVLALKREKQELLKKILGAHYNPERDLDAPRYATLSPEKAAAVAAIVEDYQLLHADLQEESLSPFTVSFPEDREKRALLVKEQRADLATAATMRVTMESFEPTEQEFRAIFALQHESDERLRLLAVTDSKAAASARTKAKSEIDTQVKQLLGDQRYAELQRSRDNEYRRLYQMSQLLELPPDSAATAYEIKTDIDNRARVLKLPPNPDANAIARHAAARLALADEAERRFADALGSRGFEVFQASSTFIKTLRTPPAVQKK